MESLSRRRFLQAAGLGFLAGAWPRTASATPDERSLLVVWLGGGASQLETWDPHPISTTGSVKTSIAGLSIADFLPRMAERMRHLSVIRSLVSREGDHRRATYAVKTGYRMDPTVAHPTLGALLSHERPPAGLDLPSYVSLGGQEWSNRGGYLGPRFDAFRVHDARKRGGNIAAYVDEDRMKRRLEGLRVTNEAFARQAEAKMHRVSTEAALKMMHSPQVAAFDVSDEPKAVRHAYGEGKFGTSCLVARRLLEQGVRAVEVTLDGFDAHINNHETHAEVCPILDQGFAALLDDLLARDLTRKVTIVCISEFGRTPKINGLDGRDHWPRAFSCVVGGAGLRKGRVIGETDPQGEAPSKGPVPIEDLGATLITALGMDPTDELDTPAGRPMPLSRGSAIKELLP